MTSPDFPYVLVVIGINVDRYDRFIYLVTPRSIITSIWSILTPGDGRREAMRRMRTQ